MGDEPVIRRLDGSTIAIAEADRLARRVLADAHITGAQLVVVQDGALRWSAAYGLRTRAPERPMDRETTTWAASLTKAVFATYVMQLVEQGRFQLDVPVASQLRRPLTAYLGYRQSASALVADPRWASVTPRMLLAHTAGLGNFASLEPDHRVHLYAQPGTAFRYSGDGINLVQLLVEEQQGAPLDVLMRAALFAPLGMTRTGLVFDPAWADDVADRFDTHGVFIAQTRRTPARAAGSMSASADDLGAFLAALLDGRVLRPSTREAMLTPQVAIRSLHQFPLHANEGMSDETARVGLAYGLGWGLLTTTPYGPAFFKEGHGDGAQNYAICFPRQRTCMIILTNSDNGETAFRALLEGIIGDDETPWEWEGYTPDYIEQSRALGN
ncbi:MAG: serine hydrolase domain-containing protein [Vulcanimicrobiaceae bacterium]